jgi:hypothetical protein
MNASVPEAFLPYIVFMEIDGVKFRAQEKDRSADRDPSRGKLSFSRLSYELSERNLHLRSCRWRF